ncbi:protein disulfide-isomerase-like protein of the testis [Sorex araneus]|uniref:protein disulfide-isomerase-like protein of the testis n=1 Tax=Sorex araneus TaxID=42254 RepID=UPI002433AFD3|nr:protein disulfide-isomerase-like protein of the testis [Sorex araneus]
MATEAEQGEVTKVKRDELKGSGRGLGPVLGASLPRGRTSMPMALPWATLLLVAWRLATAQGSLEHSADQAGGNRSRPLHIRTDQNLLVLTAAGLTQMLDQTRFLMVLFHDPSAKQSRSLAEELGRAVEMLGKGKHGVGFGKVDITVETDLREEFKVQEAPELKLFFEGNRSEPISCQGVVESAALVVWLRRQIRQKVFLFTDMQEAVIFVNSRPLVIMGFFQDLEEEVAELFYDTVKDFPELPFGVISIGNAAGGFHVILDSVLVFKKGKVVVRQELVDDMHNKQDLRQVIKRQLTHLVIEYNLETKDLIYELQIVNHMMLFVSKTSEASDPIIQDYKLAAKEFQNKILFILMDTDEPRNRRILEYFQITEVDIPCVQILNLSADARYKMPSDEITYEELKKFGQSFLKNKAKKHQSSEELPKLWDQQPVKQLVGDNFNSVVFDKARDVFVMFYAPWSAKCRALFPVLEELGGRYQNHPTVTVARIDITANDLQPTYLDRYPFFRLFPTDSQEVVQYKGEHTLEAFTDFLKGQVKARTEDEEELMSVEPDEEIEAEIPEHLEIPPQEKELPARKLPELENMTKLEEPVGGDQVTKKAAKPKRPPQREPKPRTKEEL